MLSGVPQGSVLGPILFLIFINDLPDNIRSSVRLFADDCVLYRNIHSIQDCFILQEDLTSLGQWEADWQMKFNVAKCHSMRVTRHQHHKQILFDYSLHNQTLENVQSAKYLGITISDNMDWGQHISEIKVAAGVVSEDLVTEKKWCQSSRKRRITRIGTHVFSLGRMIFAMREFCVRMFF